MQRLISICFVVAACVDQPTVDVATQAACVPVEPGDCIPPAPALTAPDAVIVSRTLTKGGSTNLLVQFGSSASWTSSALQRRAPDGAWATIASFAGGFAGTRSYTDMYRGSDSIFCYRVRVSDGTTTDYGDESCALTHKPGSVAINRLQLRLVVANVADAGTGDNVGVNLSELALPGYNHTGLDYAPVRVTSSTPPYITWVDDFARAKDFTYDLDATNIATVHDISQIEIHKYGTDGLCVQSFQLLINNKVAFTKTFGSTSSTCQWIDGNDGHSPVFTVPFSELRAAPSFDSFTNDSAAFVPCPDGIGPLCIGVTRKELEQRFEGMIGNRIWVNSELYWDGSEIYDGRATEVSRVDNDTIKVDFDLTADAGIWPDPEVDVDFEVDLAFAPATGGGFDLVLTVHDLHVNVDFDWWFEMLGFGVCATWGDPLCIEEIEDFIASEVSNGFDVRGKRIPFGQAGGCASPQVLVNENGVFDTVVVNGVSQSLARQLTFFCGG